MRRSLELLARRDEPVKYDREAFAREFTKLLTTPGYTSNKSSMTNTFQDKDMAKKEDKPTTVEEELLDELVREITKAFSECEETFMLSAPMALTVQRSNGTFTKQAHVGSEDFRPLRCYMGKKGKFIYVFQPVMIADYQTMEMDETQAAASLIGLKEWMSAKLGDTRKRRDELRAQMLATQETKKLEDRFETYKDLGFGSW